MPHQLELPALYASSPLGFLAALGTLQLTTHVLDQAPRLSWKGPDAPAVLHTHQPLTHATLAELLATQLPAEPDKDPLATAPGILNQPRHLEPGSPNDPLQMPIDEALTRLRTHAQAERDHDDNRARWFTSLINTLSIAPSKSTKNDISRKRASAEAPPTLYTRTTPYFGRSGQMTLPNNWAKAAQHCINNPRHLLAALTQWERVDDYAGANLDHLSTGDAHMVSHGKPAQQGVPGATWLALHCFVSFRLTGNNNRPHVASWDTTHNAFIWPIWQPPHSTTALTALLEHPDIRAGQPDAARLRNLGVIALYTAPRTRLSHGDGPLEPGRRIVPRINVPQPAAPHIR
ncbi:type I-G CRISPR-associated protein, Cas3-extension family [Streptomyces litmocidini]|uniref:type I-G CRISPR-associated protein, Cas3-extension family n=1 Tax=Streptomyces litmocidini TaxID=67318 RepID=UPI003702097D